jgi:hypothetical protein
MILQMEDAKRFGFSWRGKEYPANKMHRKLLAGAGGVSLAY